MSKTDTAGEEAQPRAKAQLQRRENEKRLRELRANTLPFAFYWEEGGEREDRRGDMRWMVAGSADK